MSCPACISGSTHDHDTPKGEMTRICDVECYVTPPNRQPVKSTSTIIFFCDAFGLKLINNKILADAYAEGTGMRVLVPACIPGGGLDIWVMASVDEITKPVSYLDFWGQFNRIKHLTWAVPTFITFVIKSNPGKVYPSILEWTRKLKNEVPAGTKLGAAGFCWGGYISTKLSTATITSTGSDRLLDASFIAHPSGMRPPNVMAVDAVKTYKVPCSFAIPESDGQFSLAKVDETEAELTRLKEDHQDLQYEFQIYKGMGHGFAVRGDSKDDAVLDAMERAKKQAIDWFNKWL